MKVYRNGVKTYTGGVGDHERAPRGDVVGWTAATARRQRDFLWTVDAEALSGFGYAVTLTMRELTPDAPAFHRLREAWLKRMARMGATRVHWVIEWQARGVPHLHGAVYFDRELEPMESERLDIDWQQNGAVMLTRHWLQAVRKAGYSAEFFSQDVKPIDGALGWIKYLSKHASRGAAHYQRTGHPESWDKTGRMWGHTGQWPTLPPIELGDLSNQEFWRLRRILRNWAVADAHRAGDVGRERYLKKAGRPSERYRSSYQGVAEWVPEDVSLRVIEWMSTE